LARALFRGKRQETFLGYYGPLPPHPVESLGRRADRRVRPSSLGHRPAPRGAPSLVPLLRPVPERNDLLHARLGDVLPRVPLTRLLTVVEAGLGFGFLALVIAYLPASTSPFPTRGEHLAPGCPRGLSAHGRRDASPSHHDGGWRRSGNSCTSGRAGRRSSWRATSPTRPWPTSAPSTKTSPGWGPHRGPGRLRPRDDRRGGACARQARRTFAIPVTPWWTCRWSSWSSLEDRSATALRPANSPNCAPTWQAEGLKLERRADADRSARPSFAGLRAYVDALAGTCASTCRPGSCRPTARQLGDERLERRGPSPRPTRPGARHQRQAGPATSERGRQPNRPAGARRHGGPPPDDPVLSWFEPAPAAPAWRTRFSPTAGSLTGSSDPC